MKVLFGCFSNPSVVKIPLSSATALRSFHRVRLAVPIPSVSGARQSWDRSPVTTGVLNARSGWDYETPGPEPLHGVPGTEMGHPVRAAGAAPKRRALASKLLHQ